VDDVGKLCTKPTDRESVLFNFLDEGVDVRLVGEQELDVIAAGEPQIAVAVFVGDIAKLSDRLDLQQARRCGANRKDLAA
jgi:hypothetical protein